MNIEKLVKENALKLLIFQLKQIKKYLSDRKNDILNEDKKYKVRDCCIEIGKIEAFDEIENIINKIIIEYEKKY